MNIDQHEKNTISNNTETVQENNNRIYFGMSYGTCGRIEGDFFIGVSGCSSQIEAEQEITKMFDLDGRTIGSDGRIIEGFSIR